VSKLNEKLTCASTGLVLVLSKVEFFTWREKNFPSLHETLLSNDIFSEDNFVFSYLRLTTQEPKQLS